MSANNPEDRIEPGQLVLIEDLKALLAEAERGAFGDFSNVEYPAPKMALRGKFLVLAENVIEGKYD
jgi:hypothetical protein